MSDTITVSAHIKAGVEKTWEYYTTPYHITQWNFADPSWHCPSAENNMVVGGRYMARMEAKDGSFGFDFEATYTAIETGKRFTYVFDDRVAEVSFMHDKAGTMVTITFNPESENPVELQQQGWQAILNNFKHYVETH